MALETGRLDAQIRSCLIFYTRFAVRPAVGETGFAEAQWAAPIAGLAVGLAGALALGSSLWFGVPSPVAAMLALAVTMLASGALHEDGLADIADGFGGGRTRERKLEIMRDSPIGAYGAAALCVGILLRWSSLSALAAHSGVQAMLALLAAHTASRALFPLFMRTVPPARTDGLSAGIGSIGETTAWAALAIGGVTLLLLGLSKAILACILLGLIVSGLRRLALAQIGGQTGDVLGALQQAAEAGILIVASANLT